MKSSSKNTQIPCLPKVDESMMIMDEPGPRPSESVPESVFETLSQIKTPTRARTAWTSHLP